MNSIRRGNQVYFLTSAFPTLLCVVWNFFGGGCFLFVFNEYIKSLRCIMAKYCWLTMFSMLVFIPSKIHCAAISDVIQ